MNTNKDYMYYWAIAQTPIMGIDKTRGTDSHPSRIEISVFREGIGGTPQLVYLNPLVRVQFFTQPEADAYAARFRADCQSDDVPVGELEKSAYFDTREDPMGRSAYYLPVNGELVPLGRLRFLASTGKDVNGDQVYADSEYVIRPEGPGKFTYKDGVIGFVPPRRVA